jgi:uroporphyrinogen-III synthase
LDKRVFISKNASEVEVLNRYLESKGSTLFAHSFLHFSPLHPEIKEEYDLIFFGSPRSVTFFKDQYEIPKNTEIACVGSSTAESVKSLGLEIAFLGDNQGNINEVAESFKNWCGDRKVLFPISSRSLKTFSTLFEKKNKIEIEIYDTIIVGQEVPPCATYIFTSPSNLEGFLNKNEIPQNTRIIAWGDSTRKSIERSGIRVDHVLDKPSIEKVIEILGQF